VQRGPIRYAGFAGVNHAGFAGINHAGIRVRLCLMR
jgi:hypothetical protein